MTSQRFILIGLVAATAASFVVAGWQTIRVDLLNHEKEELLALVDELEFGSERRFGIAQKFAEEGKAAEALAELAKLVKKHPQSAANPTVIALRTQVEQVVAEQGRAKEEAEAKRLAQKKEADGRKRLLEQSQGIVVWDTKWDKGFPPDFKATDPKNMFNLLRDALPQSKDAYETDADYRNRVKEAGENLKVGIYGYKDIFVFEEYDNQLYYDPYRKRFHKTIPSEYLSVNLLTERNEGTTYIGQNAFGASRNVTSIQSISWKLSIKNHRELRQGRYETHNPEKVKRTSDKTYADIVVPLSPEEARLLDKKLKVLYLVKIIPPYVEVQSFSSEPTYNSPQDTKYHINKIVINLIEVIIYRADTGQILARTTLR